MELSGAIWNPPSICWEPVVDTPGWVTGEATFNLWVLEVTGLVESKLLLYFWAHDRLSLNYKGPCFTSPVSQRLSLSSGLWITAWRDHFRVNREQYKKKYPELCINLLGLYDLWNSIADKSHWTHSLSREDRCKNGFRSTVLMYFRPEMILALQRMGRSGWNGHRFDYFWQ